MELADPIVGRRRVSRRWVPLWLMRLVIDWEPPFDWIFWRCYERRSRPRARTGIADMRRRTG